MEPLYGYVCVNCGAIDEFDPDVDSDIDFNDIINELDDTGPLFACISGWVEPCVCVDRYCTSMECEHRYDDEPGYEIIVKVMGSPIVDIEPWERDRNPSVDYFEILATKIMPPGTPVTEHLSAVVKFDNRENKTLTEQEKEAFKTYVARYEVDLATEVNQRLRTEFNISFNEAVSIIRKTNTGQHVSPDSLRNDLKPIIEHQQKCYEAYQRAIKDDETVVVCFLKFFFIGAPLSGKTSTRRRLVGEIKNLKALEEPINSTGIAETSSVVIKKMVSESIAISKPLLWQVKNKRGSVGDLAQLFLNLIATRAGTEMSGTEASGTETSGTDHKASGTETPGTETPGTHANQLKSSTVVVPNKQSTPATTVISDRRESFDDTPIYTIVDTCRIEMAFQQLENLIKLGNLDSQLDELTMANMIDVGGQPAFLEMLPALTVGPAMYFVFFRLDQELQKLYEVHFLTKENKDLLLQSSYCIETVIFQLLSTIACFSSHLPDSKSIQSSSHALLFGTFRDKVTQEDVDKVQATLYNKLRTTGFYKENLLRPAPVSGQLVITVDNMDGEESEITEIQRQIERIVETSFKKTPLPVSWLLFRIILQSLQKPIVSLADCQIIANRLHMSTPVEEVLWFLHHDTGIVLYYQDIPSMKNIVICDPQVIYDSVSKLIIETFKKGALSATLTEVDDFHEKGLFILSSIREKTKDTSSYLSVDELIEILRYHNILATINSADEAEVKFIMFAILQSASDEELQQQRKYRSEDHSGPLLIYFECGYVPYGVFCAEITHLIAHQDGWLLFQEKIRKNMVTFCVERAFHVTLMSHPQYLEVQVSRPRSARTRKSLNQVCVSVQETVTHTLNTVIMQMKYKPYGSPQINVKSPFKLAFLCSLENHDNHLMTVKNEENEWFAECIGGSHVEVVLSEKHLIWFADQSESTTNKHLKLDDSNHFEVTHHLLDLIEWRSNHKGKIKKIKIYSSSAQHWETIACRLGIKRERIVDIKRQGVGRSEIDFHIVEVLRIWLDNAINLPHADKYSKTWNGLITLLNDSSLGELASKLENALQSPYSNVRNTL